jgi:hypothetical protein
MNTLIAEQVKETVAHLTCIRKIAYSIKVSAVLMSFHYFNRSFRAGGFIFKT